MVEAHAIPLMLAEIRGEAIGMITILGGMGIAVIAIVGGYISRTVRARAFEASRREISAYVAEGSISAEDAAKLLAVGGKPDGQSCT